MVQVHAYTRLGEDNLISAIRKGLEKQVKIPSLVYFRHPYLSLRPL